MMKIAVLGSTGPTGQGVVRLCLQAGYETIAVVRNPDLMKIEDDKLKVAKANVLSPVDLAEKLSGCQAVISCLGLKGQYGFSRISFYSDSIKSVVEAARKANITRIVCLSSTCTLYDRSHPFMLEWVWKPLLLGRKFADMARMEDYLLKECQDINFTVVKAPALNDDTLDPREMLAAEGQIVLDGRGDIPRANVSKFMFNVLQNDAWYKKLCAIAIPK